MKTSLVALLAVTGTANAFLHPYAPERSMELGYVNYDRGMPDYMMNDQGYDSGGYGGQDMMMMGGNDHSQPRMYDLQSNHQQQMHSDFYQRERQNMRVPYNLESSSPMSQQMGQGVAGQPGALDSSERSGGKASPMLSGGGGKGSYFRRNGEGFQPGYFDQGPPSARGSYGYQQQQGSYGYQQQRQQPRRPYGNQAIHGGGYDSVMQDRRHYNSYGDAAGRYSDPMNPERRGPSQMLSRNGPGPQRNGGQGGFY